mgnify:CR=1 FL=1
MPLKLNINSEVVVILTEFGARVYNKYYMKFYTAAPSFECNAVEKGHELKIELWHLMQIFGEHLYNGAPHIPFEENCLTLTILR